MASTANMAVLNQHTEPVTNDEFLRPVVTSSKTGTPIRSCGTAWMYLFDWYPSRYSSQEKKLLRKLDIVLLTFGCLALFMKRMDTSNLHNAYVSGMKEDLHLESNQYSLFGTFYDIGSIISQIPALLILSRPSSARYFIPCMEVSWSILTFAQSRVDSSATIFATRFLLGILETPVSSGLMFILSSWYRPNELFKRAGVWSVSSSIGGIVSGYLQAVAYTHLSNKGGLAGWRWLFIIDGCISMPIAFLGFILFPGLPTSCKPWWMTAEEHQLAARRMKDEGVAVSKKFSWDSVKRVFTRWHFYIAVLCYALYLSSCYPAGQMALWLKDANAKHQHHWSIPQINTLPTAVSAFSIVITILSTSLCMIYPIWTIVSFCQIFTLVGTIIFLVWHVSLPVHFLAYFLFAFTTAFGSIFVPWVNIIMKDDAEARAFTTGAMIMVATVVLCFYPITIFPVLQAPRWKRGYTVSVVLVIMVWFTFMVGHLLHRREVKGAGHPGMIVSNEESQGSQDEKYVKVEAVHMEFKS